MAVYLGAGRDGVVYAAHFGGLESVVSRRTNAYMALILLSIQLICFFAQSVIYKKQFYLGLAE